MLKLFVANNLKKSRKVESINKIILRTDSITSIFSLALPLLHLLDLRKVSTETFFKKSFTYQGKIRAEEETRRDASPLLSLSLDTFTDRRSFFHAVGPRQAVDDCSFLEKTCNALVRAFMPRRESRDKRRQAATMQLPIHGRLRGHWRAFLQRS